MPRFTVRDRVEGVANALLVMEPIWLIGFAIFLLPHHEELTWERSKGHIDKVIEASEPHNWHYVSEGIYMVSLDEGTARSRARITNDCAGPGRLLSSRIPQHGDSVMVLLDPHNENRGIVSCRGKAVVTAVTYALPQTIILLMGVFSPELSTSEDDD